MGAAVVVMNATEAVAVVVAVAVVAVAVVIVAAEMAVAALTLAVMTVFFYHRCHHDGCSGIASVAVMTVA